MRLNFGPYSIRDWDSKDEDALVAYANNRKIWRNMLDRFPHPYTRADAREWLRRSRKEEPAVNFAITTGGEAIGAIGLKLQQDVAYKSAEVGYWLGEPFWGKGIAPMALWAFTAWAFERSGLGLERLFAGVFAWNPASTRVLEKAGYAYEGRLRRHVFKDGEFTDLLIYARLRDDA
ncbi:MAG: GNAT family N-acetyltransferase, partial [Dehalococcoidia bacterium]